MAAYASLLSLAQTLENLIHSQKVDDDRSQSLVSLHQKLEALLTGEPATSIDPGVISPLFSFSQTLGSYIQENQQRFDVDQFASLHNKIILFQEVFDKFPHRVSKWEATVSCFSFLAESMIELLSVEILFQRGNTKYKDSLFQIAKIIGELFDSIFDDVKNMIDSDESSPPTKLPPYGNQIVRKDRLFGLDHQLDEIKNHLLSHVKKVEIVPIVGMGGIGKTSLARAAFDLPSVARFFDLRRWVNVSQGYNAKAIMLAILDDKSPDGMSTNIIDLGIRINKMLYGRRYLIVFDDIWDLDAWDEVQKFLRNDENRSRVVLTTRHEDLARYTKPSGFIHHMQLMNQETSWSLLKYKVFGEQPCPVELLEIGEKIANGCCGLPVAIVVISGILSNINLDFDSWEKIARDVNEAIETSDDHFMEILTLSYHHLPHYLRPCFLYMSAFPKDECIHVSSLVKLWVAEGFLKPKHKSKDAEQTAYEYLEELLNRNLITAKKLYDGRTKTCEMHDLLRDLCITKAQEEKFFKLKHTLGEKITYRASFRPDASFPFIFKPNLQDLRSGLCFVNNSKLLSWLEGCTRLRVLDASMIIIDKFPSWILRSNRHLRFLALKWTPRGAFMVPSDLHRLENLETFILKYEYNSIVEENMYLVMPAEIWKLPKLRHLHLYPASNLPSPPTGNNCPALANLRSLLVIRNLCFTDEMVKMVPNLRKLVACYWIDSSKETWSDFQFKNLGNLKHLEHLSLKFTTQGYDLEWCKKYPLVKSLTFPASLKVLKFEGGAARASWEDMTRLTGSLPNLQVLKLNSHALSGDLWETSEEDYQNLRVLEISCSDLRYWRSESSSPFPCLESLVLIACPFLIEFPDGIGDIPNLKSITLDDRQEAIVSWVKRIQEEQCDLGNKSLHVTIYKLAEMMEDGDIESKKAKLFKIWTDAAGDKDLKKKIVMSMLDGDKDGLKYLIESISPELHMAKVQEASALLPNVVVFAFMYWLFVLYSLYSYWTSHI